MPLIRKGCLKVMVSRRERVVMLRCLSQTILIFTIE
jgi:non-homologous end joining protein Ku